MTPSQLRDLSQLAEAKKKLEQARLQPELTERLKLLDEIASLRQRASQAPTDPSDPTYMLRYIEHLAFLEKGLKEKLQRLSSVEARIAIKSPALARATARKDVADRLLDDAQAEARRRKEDVRYALSNQLTS